MRKKQLITFKLILLTALILINFSCEKENIIEENNSTQKGKVIKEVPINELLKNQKFKTLFEKASGNHVFSRSAFEDQNGFTISNENVKVIETDSVISYTMLIQRDNNTDPASFENLVLQEDIFNNKQAYLFKYTPTSITNAADNSFIFEGTIQKNYLTYTELNKNTAQNTVQSDCYTVVLMCNNLGTEHVAGAKCDWRFVYYKQVKVMCPADDSGGGSDTSNPYGTGGAGDTNVPPTNEPSPTPADLETEPEIVTSPVKPKIDVVKTPCSELKKLNVNNSIQQTLRILKMQSSGQSEHGNYISDATNSVGASYLSFPVIPQNPNNPNEIDISAGYPTGKVRGAMHCHIDPTTTGMFPMFSAADFGALYGIAYNHVPTNNTEKDYAEYTVMLSVGSGHYALKFKNFNGDYNAKFNLNFADFQEDLEEENIGIGHLADSSLLIKAFLKNMNKYFGNEVGLYKATESTDSNGLSVVTGWKEQTLNENGDIVQINCQ